jgi:hypothetical protein
MREEFINYVIRNYVIRIQPPSILGAVSFGPSSFFQSNYAASSQTRNFVVQLAVTVFNIQHFNRMKE